MLDTSKIHFDVNKIYIDSLGNYACDYDIPAGQTGYYLQDKLRRLVSDDVEVLVLPNAITISTSSKNYTIEQAERLNFMLPTLNLNTN